MPGSTGVFRDSDDDIGGILIQEDELLKKIASRSPNCLSRLRPVFLLRPPAVPFGYESSRRSLPDIF